MIPELPTLSNILDGSIVEGPHYDFKRALQIDDRGSRPKLIDDVVAFLNAGPGHIIFGVAERRGACEAFHPITGDRDLIEQQLLSIVQDNIAPKPLGVLARFIDVAGGFLVDLDIPAHRMQPYQNMITGGFYVRTGAKNTPVSREAIRSMFVSLDEIERDAVRLAAEEERRTRERNILSKRGATLELAALPRDHYDRATPLFDRRFPTIRSAPAYHNPGHGGIFESCDDGFEAIQATFEPDAASARLFMSHTWFLYSQVAFPFVCDAAVA